MIVFLVRVLTKEKRLQCSILSKGLSSQNSPVWCWRLVNVCFESGMLKKRDHQSEQTCGSLFPLIPPPLSLSRWRERCLIRIGWGYVWICPFVLHHPEERAVCIDEQIDLALDQNPRLTDPSGLRASLSWSHFNILHWIHPLCEEGIRGVSRNERWNKRCLSGQRLFSISGYCVLPKRLHALWWIVFGTACRANTNFAWLI